jgi:hypothetical protein
MRNYGSKENAVVFWLVHGSIEVDHADWTLTALSALNPNVEEARAAAILIAKAWWSFLDEREALAA